MAFAEDHAVDDTQQARQFFGFGPDEPIDLITLRSRRFNKERLARTDEDKRQVAHYFRLLAAQPPAPPPPRPEPTPPAAKAPPAAQEEAPSLSAGARSQQVDQVWPKVRADARSLLEDPVIQNTFGVMNRIRANLQRLASLVAGGADFLPADQREEMVEMLLRVTSESIREALHRGELPITNGVIRAKNAVLASLGVEIPDAHREINASDYSHNW